MRRSTWPTGCTPPTSARASSSATGCTTRWWASTRSPKPGRSPASSGTETVWRLGQPERGSRSMSTLTGQPWFWPALLVVIAPAAGAADPQRGARLSRPPRQRLCQTGWPAAELGASGRARCTCSSTSSTSRRPRRRRARQLGEDRGDRVRFPHHAGAALRRQRRAVRRGPRRQLARAAARHLHRPRPADPHHHRDRPAAVLGLGRQHRRADHRGRGDLDRHRPGGAERGRPGHPGSAAAVRAAVPDRRLAGHPRPKAAWSR